MQTSGEVESQNVPELIGTILNDAQLSRTKHQQYSAKLTQLISCNFRDSLKFLVQSVNRILVIKESYPSVEIIIHFFSKFIAYATKEGKLNTDMCDNLLEKFLLHLVKAGESANKTVRWRSCQLLSSIINQLEYSIEDELWERIETFLLQRLKDKCVKVRKYSISALQRFQNLDDVNNIVIDKLCQTIESETNKELKIAILKILCITPFTIPYFLSMLQSNITNRSTSVKDFKKNIFKRFCSVDFHQFKDNQLVFLLSQGLREPPEVKAIFEKMVDNWICDQRIIKLLEFVNVEKNEKVLETLLAHLIEKDKLDYITDPNSKEEFFMYRVYLSQLKKKDICEFEEKAMKVKEVISKIESNMKEKTYFVVKQLLIMCNFYDIHNEFERNELSSLIRINMLESDLPEEIHYYLTKTLRSLHDETNFLRIILEILADVTDVHDNYGTEDSDQEENTPFPINPIPDEALSHNLILCEELLLNSSLSQSSRDMIIGILETIILPSVQHTNIKLREKGLKCLGLFCLMDQKYAGEFLLLFVQAAQKDNTAIQRIAAQCLFDFLSTFDPLYLIAQESSWPDDLITQSTKLGEHITKEEKVYTICCSEIHSFTMTTLITLLRHGDPLVRCTAVEGFSKLLLNNHITDHHILAVMITLYFHPAIAETPRILYCLNSFFYSYSISEKHKEIIFKSFQPTLTRILNSTKYSPLKIISIPDVFTFIVSLLRLQPDDEEVQSSEATPYSNVNSLISQMLEEIITKDNFTTIKSIIKLIDQQLYYDGDNSEIQKIQSLFSILQTKTLKLDQPSLKLISTITEKLPPPSAPSSPLKRTAPDDADELYESPPKCAKITEMDSPFTRILNSIPRVLEVSSKKRKNSPLYKPPSTKKQKMDGTSDILNFEIDDDDLQEDTFLEPHHSQAISISFTGFTEEDEVYNEEYQRTLELQARRLNATIIEGKDMSPNITHIICPPFKRTLKTVIGYLSNCWVLPPTWLLDSVSFGYFLNEASYGKRGEKSAMEGKKIFVSSEFLQKSPNRQITPKLFKELLVGFGKGTITTNTKEADVILHSENLSRKYSGKNKPLFLTWKTFFKFLQPAS